MGKYAKQILERFTRELSASRESADLPGELQDEFDAVDPLWDVESLVEDDYDPMHAVYACSHNATTLFVEAVSRFPELAVWREAIEAAQDEYTPEGPPISPLTGSFFWSWAIYDFRIGRSTDTMALCQLVANDVIRLGGLDLNALENLALSRMGIYEQIGHKGDLIRLQELVTGATFDCHCPTDYSGKRGELWYVRLADSLDPETAPYSIMITTPYILVETKKSDWVSYLQRAMPKLKGESVAERLYDLLKHGRDRFQWHEFVFQGYVDATSEVVYLTGIPDRPETLPHA